MAPSSLSMMPSGLLDTFSKEEILDLLAYIRAGVDSVDSLHMAESAFIEDVPTDFPAEQRTMFGGADRAAKLTVCDLRVLRVFAVG